MNCTMHHAFTAVIVSVLLGATTAAWAAQSFANYPERPIRLIQPFPPGGGSDAVARYVGQRLSERLGQTIVVDNRGGAGGSIGTEIASRATPDGYTLLMATASTVVINPLVHKVAFDPIKDFDPVIYASTIPLILVVNPKVPVKSVKDLIALARTHPGKLNFSSSGEGTISHLAGELFKVTTAVNMVHVPYRGGGPARNAIIAGQVQVNFGNMLSTASHVRAGQLRALAVTTLKRAEGMSDVPTMVEAGVPGYEVVQWNGMLAPHGVPHPIIERINKEFNRILELPETRRFFTAGGSEAAGGTPQKFGAFIKSEIAKWKKVIKAVGPRTHLE